MSWFPKEMALVFLLVIALISDFCAALPQKYADAYILRYDNDIGDGDAFSFNVETSDGFKHEAKGELRNAGSENEILVVQGSYSYVGDDGKTYEVRYIADDNGFQPMGDHIPSGANLIV